MSRLRSLLCRSTLIPAFFAGSYTANAQSPTCYTLESLQGSFAVIGTYGNNIAASMSVRSLDAFGNMPTPALVLINLPVVGSATGERAFQTASNTATYSINCDGTGVVTRHSTLANGTAIQGFDDFFVTEGIVQNGKLVATAMEDASRVPSSVIPGTFLTRKYSRIPDPRAAGCYTRESLQGSYGFVGNFTGSIALALLAETLDGRGNNASTGLVNQPSPGSSSGERSIVNVSNTGPYNVNCDGTGTIKRLVTRPDGTTAVTEEDFLITAASERDGKLVATRIFSAQRVPSVILPGGVFVTITRSLRPAPKEAGPTTPPQQSRTTAVAGPKNSSETARSIQLDGTKSTSVNGKALTYSWTMAQGGPMAVILGAATATPTVQFAQGRGAYTFLLTVADSTGGTASDTVTVDYRGN